MPSKGTIVVAVGGNSLIIDKDHISVKDQFLAAEESMGHVVDMVEDGWNVVVTHGNGPQVGFLLRRVELAIDELPAIPLDILGADTQGATGYMFTDALRKYCEKRGLDRKAVAVVTQTEVDPDDPAFHAPTKPIGSFMDEAEARKREAEDGWHVVEDSGRGFRRVVASPEPVSILEIDAIRALTDAGFLVVAAGGGGIPVVKKEIGYKGVEAVIDKDFATALLAAELNADVLLISTAVDAVAIGFNTPEEKWLDRITVAQAKEYVASGEFGKGSMEPKILAAIRFIENGGGRAIITSPGQMAAALRGEAGTTILP